MTGIKDIEIRNTTDFSDYLDSLKVASPDGKVASPECKLYIHVSPGD